MDLEENGERHYALLRFAEHLHWGYNILHHPSPWKMLTKKDLTWHFIFGMRARREAEDLISLLLTLNVTWENPSICWNYMFKKVGGINNNSSTGEKFVENVYQMFAKVPPKISMLKMRNNRKQQSAKKSCARVVAKNASRYLSGKKNKGRAIWKVSLGFNNAFIAFIFLLLLFIILLFIIANWPNLAET